MSKIQSPKGVSEYFPPRSAKFEYVRNAMIAAAKNAGYWMMELPIFEETELFVRGVGESTDVVSKEMYTFEDRGGRSITLRPEGTAGVMRSVIEHNLDKGQLPVKVWYSGPFFRAERPQAGRYRQFYQVGIEAIGADDPEIDAEVIAVAHRAFTSIGLSNFRLDLTSLGDSESRSRHRKDLVAYIETLDLDEATKERSALNPLRLFDDKREEIRAKMSNAPLLVDYLNADAAAHFEQVQRLLRSFDIPFTLNPRMVRGLDYYTGTTFEFVHEGLGAQSGIGGGGRYDGLMADLGGANLSGIGFGLGVDRVLLAAEAEGLLSEEKLAHDPLDIFLIAMIPAAKDSVALLTNSLRNLGVRADMAYGDRALKGAMKSADKSGARFSVVIGEDEIASGVVKVKNMESGSTESITLGDLNAWKGALLN
ncbi:MAG: histidine--tRNA ligase [Actinobacteria bacterium]|uniref:histidine--tRNA ligase n=1 Tax=freshwater metagenome TaxID=449393 RepID=A0A6J6B1R7_9ZZZZ|nr:histidine--tRNA ligase [Actinomycetota bacterium]